MVGIELPFHEKWKNIFFVKKSCQEIGRPFQNAQNHPQRPKTLGVVLKNVLGGWLILGHTLQTSDWVQNGYAQEWTSGGVKTYSF